MRLKGWESASGAAGPPSPQGINHDLMSFISTAEAEVYKIQFERSVFFYISSGWISPLPPNLFYQISLSLSLSLSLCCSPSWPSHVIICEMTCADGSLWREHSHSLFTLPDWNLISLNLLVKVSILRIHRPVYLFEEERMQDFIKMYDNKRCTVTPARLSLTLVKKWIYSSFIAVRQISTCLHRRQSWLLAIARGKKSINFA